MWDIRKAGKECVAYSHVGLGSSASNMPLRSSVFSLTHYQLFPQLFPFSCSSTISFPLTEGLHKFLLVHFPHISSCHLLFLPLSSLQSSPQTVPSFLPAAVEALGQDSSIAALCTYKLSRVGAGSDLAEAYFVNLWGWCNQHVEMGHVQCSL